VTASTSEPTPGPGEGAPRHHRLRWTLLALVGAAVVAAGVVVLLFVTREDPDAKDVEEAVDEYRATSASTSISGVVRPAAGVYVAEGSGREELSFPPLDQEDGASIPVTVEHLADGCWRWTVDFNEAHSQSWDYCEDGGRILESGGRTYQRWDLGATTIESIADFTCEPPNLVFDPAAQPGDTWEGGCTGTNSAIEGSTLTAGPTTYVGPDELELGGTPVKVHHYRQDLTISGAQVGTNRVHYWLDDTGLAVRMEREVAVATDSPVGSITYDEVGEWQLTSLEPVD
jgi:hypothetical protein